MANKSRGEIDSETMTFKWCEQKLKSCKKKGPEKHDIFGFKDLIL